jgi:hypothetical protein
MDILDIFEALPHCCFSFCLPDPVCTLTTLHLQAVAALHGSVAHYNLGPGKGRWQSKGFAHGSQRTLLPGLTQQRAACIQPTVHHKRAHQPTCHKRRNHAARHHVNIIGPSQRGLDF